MRTCMRLQPSSARFSGKPRTNKQIAQASVNYDHYIMIVITLHLAGGDLACGGTFPNPPRLKLLAARPFNRTDSGALRRRALRDSRTDECGCSCSYGAKSCARLQVRRSVQHTWFTMLVPADDSHDEGAPRAQA
jgi:hypothetical protein